REKVEGAGADRCTWISDVVDGCQVGAESAAGGVNQIDIVFPITIGLELIGPEIDRVRREGPGATVTARKLQLGHIQRRIEVEVDALLVDVRVAGEAGRADGQPHVPG